MRNTIITSFFGMWLLLLTAHSAWGETTPTVTAYFEEWGIYDADYHVSEIPAEKLTHINYAFARVDTAGNVSLYDPYAAIDRFYPGDSSEEPIRGNFKQLKLLKEQHPHIKVLISIGGWTLSGPFYAMANTEAGRNNFAASVLQFLQTYDIFDGVDIDWEYPVLGGLEKWGSAADTLNFTLLMKAVREKIGTDYELTVAVNAGPQGIAAIDYVNVSQYLDRINIMSYDFHGPGWSSLTGHNSALYNNNDYSSTEINIHSAVNNLLAAGAPAEKLVIGLPFYGRSFANAAAPGINQSFWGAGSQTFEPGMLNYDDLATNYVNKNGYQYYWDDVAKVPYLYNATKMEFISFDDPRSIRTKSSYALDRGLNGVMFWAMTGDNGELTDAIQEGLGNSGDNGDGDSGDGDSGDGDGDSGNGDSGNGDSGDGDSGDGDSGDGDSGNGDSGDGDSGNGDSGNGNSGNGDSGNSGDIPAWSGASVVYQVGDQVTYNGNIYKVVLAHTSVGNWYPDQVWYFELVGSVGDNGDGGDSGNGDSGDSGNGDGGDSGNGDGGDSGNGDGGDSGNGDSGNIPAWSGASVAYEVGDQVSYNGNIYRVVLAHTSVGNWYPDTVWYFELVGADNSGGNGDSGDTGGNDGDNGGDNGANIPAWSGAAVAYDVGDLVSYNGDTYRVVLAHTSVANWYPDQVWYFEKQ